MNKSDRPIRKFSPGTFQSDEEVIEQFVVRKHELDIVLEVLRGNIDSPSCQHVLVVAPRGRGKTMLLARVAAEVNTDDELSGSLLPVRFMEESHEIFSLADFWLDTLFYLARESAKHDSVLAEELQEAHADLTNRWHEEVLADRVRAAVLEAADRLDKKLVLMVENLQALCGNVDKDFGWKLRGALQSEPQIILLATATSRFEGLEDAEQPFFELFRIVALEPLATEECRRLWQVVSGDEVSRREIRPLEILTGGSPRLLVIVAGFARHRSLRQLMEELVELIDDHTEYFRGHLEVLAKGERRVYISVIDLWQPSSTGEIAARARMDVRPVSTLLGRLVERGAVIAEGSGKKRWYAAAERLYSIYYKLRRERDEATVVENLIRFMVAFYGMSELYQMSGRLTSEAAESKVIREGIERALSERSRVDDNFLRMEWSVIENISASAQAEAELRLEEEIKTAIKEEAFGSVIQIIDRFVDSEGVDSSRRSESFIAYILHMKAVAYEQLADFQSVIAVCNEMVERFGDTRDISLLARMARVLVLGAIARSNVGDFQASIATCDEVVERFGIFNDPQFQQLVAAALFTKGDTQGDLGDSQAEIAAYDELIERFGDSNAPEIQKVVAMALVNKGGAREDLGDSQAEIAAYDELIERFGDSNAPEIQKVVAMALVNKGSVLGGLGDFKAEAAAYDEVIKYFSDSNALEIQVRVAAALLNRGSMQEDIGDFGGAIATCDEVVERFGNYNELSFQQFVAAALGDKGMREAMIGRAKEALHTCEELERRLGTLPAGDRKTWLEWRTMCVRALALMVREKHRAAMDVFRSAYAVFVTDNKTMIHQMQKIVPELIATGASTHELVEILSSDKAKSDALAPLIVALRQRTGEEVRAPVEVLEVAADIRERIEARAAKGTPVAS